MMIKIIPKYKYSVIFEAEQPLRSILSHLATEEAELVEGEEDLVFHVSARRKNTHWKQRKH